MTNRDKVVELRQQGKSIKEIASTVSISKQRARQILCTPLRRKLKV
jgi:DNA-directed RNA polymerase sigma subunit (sigma70/sigma32)